MDLGRFITGTLIGTTIGVAGAAYMLTSDREKRKLMRQGKQMLNKATHTLEQMF
ncbi:hypothetical protein [Sporanaerobium hydrogeniformans]|uniref:hypothetical protein n=1 Tax=Sporanaerobium hydrogeniformans TaxID=3072179 RepID=UPI0015D4AFEE|nr:hypothetical protein [Sporanaerobium hydrogeniformans]